MSLLHQELQSGLLDLHLLVNLWRQDSQDSLWLQELQSDLLALIFQVSDFLLDKPIVPAVLKACARVRLLDHVLPALAFESSMSCKHLSTLCPYR